MVMFCSYRQAMFEPLSAWEWTRVAHKALNLGCSQKASWEELGSVCLSTVPLKSFLTLSVRKKLVNAWSEEPKFPF